MSTGTDFSRRRGLHALVGGMALAAIGLTRPADAAKPMTLMPQRAIEWSDFLGVNVQFAWYDAAVRRRQLERLRALGLRWVRVNLHWSLLEPEDGRWDYAESDGSLLDELHQHDLRAVTSVVGTPRFASTAPKGSPYVDKYPPTQPDLFARRFVGLAKRYPQVEAWQIWNEPNIPGFWAPKPDPEGYGRLLRTTVEAMRSHMPDKKLVMAGMAYYSQMPGRSDLMLEALGRLGAFGLKLVVAYHPYTTFAEGSELTNRDFLARATHAHQWLRSVGVREIWATEWGWSSYAGPVEEQPLIGEAGQADRTLKRLALMAALDYDRIFLFTLGDLDRRAGPRDRRYGLLTEDAQPKPVYKALAALLAATGPRIEPAGAPRTEGGAPEGMISIGWRKPDGTKLWMFWANEPRTLRLPDVASAVLHQPMKQTRVALDRNGGIDVRVTNDLQMLEIA